MRKIITGSLCFILPGIIFYLISCVPASCLEDTESYLNASFYDTTEKKLLAPDSLTLYGLNNDSAIYIKSTGIQPARIPLNSSAETSSFVIIINGTTDTISFKYSSYPHLISKECGYTFYHHLDTLPVFTKHIIKDIYTANETITNTKIENIRIFY